MSNGIFSRPHLTAATLGTALMVIVIAAVAISYLRMLALRDVAATAMYDYHPAHDELLFIDRDLYQAQLALERGAAFADPLEREGQITIFRENVGQTATRFASYQEKAAGLSDSTAAAASYLDYRDNWLEVAQLLVTQMEQGLPSAELGPSVTRTTDAFGEMRFALDRITESVINPAIQSIQQEMTNQTVTARNQLVATLAIALIIGAVVTISGSNRIRRQYNQMLDDRDQQKDEAARKELEKRIHGAFELVQSEAAAIEVAHGVLDEIVSQTHHTELLLADSSFAHLHRATATEVSDRRGCNVLKPADCPAIRRNTKLAFAASNNFEACPFLKGRSEEGCSALCVPLNVLGRTAGVLHTVGDMDGLPNHEQEQALRALASQTGDVLGILRALSTKDRQANTDSLTGLDNRRSLETKFPAVASRGVYAIAFGDLDRFKQLNDTHGHDMGDRALRVFADVLRASLRPDDVVGRWGGEEFVIVLPGATDTRAIRVLERIRSNLRETLAIGAVPSFTVSFGVCDSRDTEVLSDVLNAADAALLRAKKEGRDRIVYGSVEELDDALSESMLMEEPGAQSGRYHRAAQA